jgi:hypothetical protein
MLITLQLRGHPQVDDFRLKIEYLKKLLEAINSQSF